MPLIRAIKSAMEKDEQIRAKEHERRFYEEVENKLGLRVCEGTPANAKNGIGSVYSYSELYPDSGWIEYCVKFGNEYFYASGTAMEKLFDKIEKLKGEIKDKNDDIKELKKEIKRLEKERQDILSGEYFKPKKSKTKRSEPVDISEIPF